MTAARSKTRSRKSGLIVPGLILCACVAGLGAPLLSATRIEFDVFSHFRLHFLGLGAAALLAIAARRFWLPVLLLGVCAVPVAIALAPNLGSSEVASVQPTASGKRIKVLTYNTWFRNDDWPALEAYLRKEDADFVVMMEFGPSKKPMLDRLKTLYPHRTDCIAVTNCYLVLLSKYPFKEAKHRTGWQGPPIIWARFGDELGGLTLIGAHLSRPPFAPRQLSQIEALARAVRKRGKPIVVAGDFNATRWSHMLMAFEKGSGLKRLTSRPTWPTYFFGLPQLGIDHIFASKEIRALSKPSRGPHGGSDHLPVSVVLDLPAR